MILKALLSQAVPSGIGLIVGIIWTSVFGPWLDRCRPDLQNWLAYAVEAVGVFVMATVLDLLGALSPLSLLASMILAGAGMFVVKAWKRRSLTS